MKIECFFIGEEVTDNYHPWFAQMPRKARREYLHQFYCFDCNCSACKNDYSTLAELKQSNILLGDVLTVMNIFAMNTVWTVIGNWM